jgi:hypothetical protein
MEVTQERYNSEKHPRRGTRNPELMDFVFWKYMIKTRQSAWKARSLFGDAEYRHGDQVWTFDRFGMSRTKLPDGRFIFVGGEHEDFYDPDFYIYNDVIVRTPDKDILIYGYPEQTFPSTDFHSATLVGSIIYLIGCLGYPEHRAIRPMVKTVRSWGQG